MVFRLDFVRSLPAITSFFELHCPSPYMDTEPSRPSIPHTLEVEVYNLSDKNMKIVPVVNSQKVRDNRRLFWTSKGKEPFSRAEEK